MKKILYIFIMSVFFLSCSEDTDFSANPSYRLEFSCDTLSFDTLFTEVNSPTAMFVVRNRNKEALRISDVTLTSGGKSGFSVLVDGQYGASMRNLELRGKDSLFVLAQVCLDRNSADIPLMVQDTLLFTLESGVQQGVVLLAYGRDVTFMRGVNIIADTVLEQGHYVVYDSLVVAPDVALEIPAGTTLYFHDKAYMKVAGRLSIAGTAQQPVTLRGDRTDNMFWYLPYDRIPGQWDGLTFTSSSYGNVISHCDIHSANYGIKVERGDTAQQRIVIESSKVHNFHGNALELVMSRATVRNSLFANAQGNCVRVVGGNVSFIHCTIANFYVWRQRDVALALYNEFEGEPAPLCGALFANCVIAGSRDDELSGYFVTWGDSIPDSHNYRFVNSLINTPETDDSCFVNIKYDRPDTEPFGKAHFRIVNHDVFDYDFHLSAESAARGLASDDYVESLPVDLDGVERVAGGADAGCFQYVELATDGE